MAWYYDDGWATLHQGDVLAVLRELPADSVNCVVTSPPYWSLRDYGVEPSVWPDGTCSALGLEPTPELFVAHMVEVFREVRRVLRPDGTLWLNMGDSYNAYNGNRGTASTYAGNREAMEPAFPRGRGLMANALKPKDLVGIPWMLAFALRADGWWLRQDIIWSKPNPMPESVTDRCTKAHEYLFLLTKRERYWSDFGAIKEPATFAGEQLGIVRGQKRRAEAMGRAPSGNEVPGADADNGDTRNKRSVWHIPTAPFPEAHFATFPPALVEPCILAGCPEGGTVLDPFAGSGTTLLVAKRLGRRSIGIELNGEYAAMIERRVRGVTTPMVFSAALQ